MNRRRLEGAALMMAIAWLSACASSNPMCPLAQQVFQGDSTKCASNDLRTCGALLQSKCQASCGVCSDQFAEFQSQAHDKLSSACQAGDQAGCRGLDAVSCDGGDDAACKKLNDEYSKLATACHAGDQSRCTDIRASAWPQRMRPDALKLCNGGDVAACAQLTGSFSVQ